MDLSVIIPSQSEPLLAAVVERVLDSAGPSSVVEVIIISSGAVPNLPADPRISVIEVAAPTWEGARYNLGLARSTGDLVVFLDGDCLPTGTWFAQIVASQDSGQCICCAGIDTQPGIFWEACYNVIGFREYLSDRPPAARRFLASYCLWGPREAFAEVRGFDESLRFAEDLDLTCRLARAGWQLRFEPAVRVIHRRTGLSFRRLLRHGWSHGRMSLKIRMRYPDAFGVSPRLMSPGFLVLVAPLVSAYFLVKTFRDSPRHRSIVIQAAAMMYLHRIAWCIGAARETLDSTRR